MSAVERVEAAIAKLEDLRGAAAPGVWVAWREGLPGRERFGVETGAEGADVVWRAARAADAELVEVLHRTIDAQLAILRDNLTRYGDKLEDGWLPTIGGPLANVLALVDAILGDAS